MKILNLWWNFIFVWRFYYVGERSEFYPIRWLNYKIYKVYGNYHRKTQY